MWKIWNHPLVQRILILLATLSNTNITFIRIPSHRGILGNGNIDKAARAPALLPLSLSHSLYPQFLPTKADLAHHSRKQVYTSIRQSPGKTRRTINSPPSKPSRSNENHPTNLNANTKFTSTASASGIQDQPTPTLSQTSTHFPATIVTPIHLSLPLTFSPATTSGKLPKSPRLTKKLYPTIISSSETYLTTSEPWTSSLVSNNNL